MTQTSIQRSQWLFVLGAICALVSGFGVSCAYAQIDETRLTQPQIAPVPDSDENNEEAEREAADDVPEDRAALLGMTIEQAPRNRAVVTEVAVNSAAEGAGIKKGDHIVALNGLKIDSYEKWFEGVQRIIRDTPDGKTVQLTIERNGRRANLPVKTLIAAATAASPRTPAGQPGQPTGPGIVTPMPAAGQPGAGFPLGSDDDFFLNNQSFFGDDVAAGRPNERAVAHLYLLAGAIQALDPQASAEPVDPVADAASTLEASANDKRDSSAGGFGAKGRIGLAGFRNREQGMLVMVDVGMLPPGNYVVGISDPSAIPGSVGGESPDAPSNPATDPTQTNPSQGAPADVGRAQQERLQEPLRQVVDEEQAVPPQSPVGEAPIQGSAPTNTQISPLAGAGAGRPTDPNASGQLGMLAQIGTLTVDQSGIGRMQDIVEGVQVADVVGQAVVIYGHAGTSPPTIPPGGNRIDSANPAPTASEAIDLARQEAQQPESAGPMPIAAGMIEIVTPRGIEGQTTESARQPSRRAPNSAAPEQGADPLPPPR